MTLHREHFSVGALGCTCTILADTDSGDAVIVDPGDEAERIFARVSALGLTVRHLLHTHAHLDHIGATQALRSKCRAPAAIHGDDVPLAKTVQRQAAFLGLDPIEEPVFDTLLSDGDQFAFGGFSVKALHTPGHTHGSTSFAVEHASTYVLMTGDTLFAGGVGRWDIGGTSLADIVRSIRKQLLCYPDAAVVVPGHGPHSTIGYERAQNAYLQ